MIATANILQERHGIMSNKGFFSRKIWNAVLDRVPFFLLKMGQPRQLLSFIFGLFKETSLQFFTTNICGKCPSSIRCRDSNPQPSERESLPITNRPGLVIVKPGTIKVKKSYFARQKFGIILNPILKVKFIAAVVVQPSLEQHQSADLLRRSSVKNCFSCGLPLRQQRFPRATFADFFK